MTQSDNKVEMERSMKRNKVIVLTALAAGGLVACGSAFGLSSMNEVKSMTTNATSKVSHWSGTGSEARLDKLQKELGLSNDQKEKVKSILGSEHQQMKDVHKDTTLSTGEKKSKMQDIRGSVDTKMKSVLTPDQYQKWEKLSHSHSHNM